MFSLFRKKQAQTKIIDRVFISSNAKNYAIQELARISNNLIFVAWFDDSYNKLEEVLRAENIHAEIFNARQVASHDVANKQVIFYGHHPLVAKENELLKKLPSIEAIFYSSLDEALFRHFGGDRIAGMMQQMGLSENEAIEHSMISDAIRNAQEKISTKVVIEYAARSQEEWLSKNLVK